MTAPSPAGLSRSPAGPAVDHVPAAPLRRLRTRRLLMVGGLAGLLLLAAALSLAVGARSVPPDAVWDALFSPSGSDDDVVVRSLRVPRTLTAVAVGVALGVAGALAQGHTRNPLADPGLLGVSAGAALAVVTGIMLGVTSPLPQAGLAAVGALLASVVVFSLGGVGRRGSSPATLALAGVVLTSLLLSLVSTVVLLDAAALDAYRFWTVGAVSGRDPQVLVSVLPMLAVGLVLAGVNAPALDLLGLGDDVAQGLGVSVRRSRLTGLLAVALLTAAATAVAGPLAFLGLVVPHVARSLTGPAHRWLVPVSGLAGAVLALLADVAGRLVARPGELQVGIVLALVGAPVLIALVRSRRLVLT